MFLKEKRDSSVKVRMCADGRKQKDGTWKYILNADTQGVTAPLGQAD